MTWFAPPPEIDAEVFTRLPDRFRRPGTPSPWGSAPKGAPVDCFLEGPAFDAAGMLWCVDIPFGRVFRIDPVGAWTLVTEYDGEPNGLRHGPDGRVWIADYRNGIMALDPDTGAVTAVLERRRGERFKGPNDLCFDADGTLYFTDQGATGLHDPSGRVFRLRPDGRLDCLLDNAPSPNGLALAPDGSTLWVTMTRSGEVWRLPLPAEGGTAKVQLFCRLPGGLSGPDGLALDEAGALYIAHAGLGRVFVTDDVGLPRLIIRVPTGRTVTNLAFGGPDRCDLHLIESQTGSILRIRLQAPGQLLNWDPRRTGPSHPPS